MLGADISGRAQDGEWIDRIELVHEFSYRLDRKDAAKEHGTVKHRPQPLRPFPPAIAVSRMRGVLRCLEQLHRRGGYVRGGVMLELV